MSAWGTVLFVALAGWAVSANELAAFPEDIDARGASTRIVSGWDAAEGQFPYQISIRMVSGEGAVSACGGSIIHTEWGLTAAHCTANRISFVIRTGGVNLTRPAEIFETTEFYLYPSYIESSASVQPNDISLVKFPRAIQLGDTVQPIRLQSSVDRNRDYSEVQMVASGWGRTWTNGDSPENLQWVYLRGISNLQCFITYFGIVTDATICAQYYNVTSQSTCQGDSGGPLTAVDADGQLSLIGVTSFVSATGCHTELPAGFIRAGHFHEWYTEVTGINFDWVPEDPVTEEPIQTEEPDISTVDPEGTTTALPEDTTTASPEDTTTASPEETTTASPEDTTTALPEDTTTASPEETTTASPEETTTASPEDTTTALPEDTTTASPEDTTTELPEDTTTASPEDTTTASPEDTTTASPEDTTTALPEDTTTASPEDTTTALPEDTTTASPEDTTTASPEDTTTALPEDTTTASPEDTTTALPEDTTTASPEDTTTALPEDTTTASPEDTTTASPEDTTTALPEDTTTASTEDTTTALPEDTTTASPEDTTTASA